MPEDKEACEEEPPTPVTTSKRGSVRSSRIRASEEKEVQRRGITMFQPEKRGGPFGEYKTSTAVLNFIDSGISGTLKAAASRGLGTTCNAPAIPSSPEDDISHTRRKVLNKSVRDMPGGPLELPDRRAHV